MTDIKGRDRKKHIDGQVCRAILMRNQYSSHPRTVLYFVPATVRR